MSLFQFTTIDDVMPHLSGMDDWEWGEHIKLKHFAQWVWAHHEDYDEGFFEDKEQQINVMLCEFCVYAGINVEDYLSVADHRQARQLLGWGEFR